MRCLEEKGIDVEAVQARYTVEELCCMISLERWLNSIDDLIVKTFIAVEPKIGQACRMFVPHEGRVLRALPA